MRLADGDVRARIDVEIAKHAHHHIALRMVACLGLADTAGVDEVLTDGISCGRSHGCTHVHGIFDTIIHYFSGGNTADTAVSLSGTGVFLGGNDKGTGTGDRPGS